MSARRDAYRVPGLERGLRVLQLFDRAHAQLAAPDIARRLGAPRSTVFRLVHTLEALGFLERAGTAWRLGPAVLRLGFEYLASLELTDLARPFVERLRDETGLAAQCAVRDGREVVIVVRAHPPSAFSSNVNVGTRMPAHATALGRAFLADLPDEELAALYPEPKLQVYGPQTPRSRAELRRILREDARRGYALSEAFFEPGISAIAAPVRDASRRVVAVISVSVFQPRIEPRALRERLIKRTLATAAEISARLDYRPEAAAA
jgi:DNA-binding IclR family transcriptional regulator